MSCCYRRLLRNDLHDFSATRSPWGEEYVEELKNELHADRAATAFFWIQLAWYFKPFAGVVTDACPRFGMRRKSYMVIGALLTVACWVAMIFTPHEYNKVLWASCSDRPAPSS